MLKEDIIKDIQKYVQSKDKSNLIVYLETNFSHNKLYKTCINAKLIKMSTKKPKSNTLALILANKLMKTKTSLWDKISVGLSTGISASMLALFTIATEKDKDKDIKQPPFLNKKQKEAVSLISLMSSILAGSAIQKVVNKGKTRKRMMSALARRSSQTRKRSSSSKPSKKRKRSSSSKPSKPSKKRSKR